MWHCWIFSLIPNWKTGRNGKNTHDEKGKIINKNFSFNKWNLLIRKLQYLLKGFIVGYNVIMKTKLPKNWLIHIIFIKFNGYRWHHGKIWSIFMGSCCVFRFQNLANLLEAAMRFLLIFNNKKTKSLSVNLSVCVRTHTLMGSSIDTKIGMK